MTPILTMRVGVNPVVGREFYWSICEGGSVRSGFVEIDLCEAWDLQADRALPVGWERLSGWSVVDDYAVAEVRRVVRASVPRRVDTSYPSLRLTQQALSVDALVELFGRMREDVAARFDGGVKRLVSAQWDRDLAALILDRNMDTASEVALRVSDALGSDYDPVVMTAWLTENAGFAAEGVNGKVAADIKLADANEQDDPVGHVFGILATTGAEGIAQQMVTTSAGFGARDAATHAGASVKVWKVNSRNPRSSHAALNGQSVSLSENFSNGMAWPGDPAGGADENARCKCSLTIVG